MHILLTGGTGFIGSALCPQLLEQGCRVTVFTRRPPTGSTSVKYVSRLDDIDLSEQFDAIINLAGASLADRRWTAAYKKEIVSSRLNTTRSVLDLLQRLQHPPRVLLSASAIGYYGHHGDEELDESGAATPGFAQQLCAEWEAMALSARELGARVCLLRLGVVLDRAGGAFSRMALPFRFGIGNWMGDGHQWLSWVHRHDVVQAILFLLQRADLEGAFNITAPNPVTSRGFCDAMKRQRSVLLSAPVPAIILRSVLGEMADELLLSGQRVIPAGLLKTGFEFEYPLLDTALADIL